MKRKSGDALNAAERYAFIEHLVSIAEKTGIRYEPMNEENLMQYFFDIHSDLPREGPGDRESTSKAFSMLKDLNKNPRILDIGCGPGMQTLDLADLTDGKIIAVDFHQPFLDHLSEKARKKGVADRVQVVYADMASLNFEPETFDLIWSEGAAYIMEVENALTSWKRLLKKRGYLAITEIAPRLRKENLP